MIVAMEYLEIFDEVNLSKGAIDMGNTIMPEGGWLRTFNTGSRRTVAVGSDLGVLRKIAEVTTEMLKCYFHIHFEPMPHDLFYEMVKTILDMQDIRYKEKPDKHNILYLVDELSVFY